MSTQEARWTVGGGPSGSGLARRVPSQQEVIVFKHHCTVCDRTQLIFPSQVRSLVNTAAGIEVTIECWCGAEQQFVTGRRVAESARRASAVAA